MFCIRFFFPELFRMTLPVIWKRQQAYCLKSLHVGCFRVENGDSHLDSYSCLSYWQTGVLYWEMWAVAEISMTVGKGSDILRAPSLGKVLCAYCKVVLLEYKNEDRHWLATVIWPWWGHLEGGGIWARLWRWNELHVSLTVKVIYDHFTIIWKENIER